MNRVSKGMVTAAFLAAMALIFAAGAAQAQEYKEITGEMSNRLGQYKEPISKWKYRKGCDEKCFQPEIPKLKWSSAAPGMYWKEAFQEFWFRREYTVPETVAGRDITGSDITLKMNISDGGEVYANGEKVGSAEGVVIAGNVKPGDEIVIGVRVYNDTWPGAYLGSDLYFSAFDKISARTGEYLSLVSSAEALIPFSEDKEKWIGILNESAAKIDMDAMAAFDEDKYFKSLDEASAVLDNLSGLYDDYTLYMHCYSHIDLAWLWDKAEGEDVTRDTLRTIFELQGEYPDWIYSHSQAHGYQWMERDYPEIFAEMKEKFKEGRLEIVGGTWSEHDSNIPGGEGFVRQFLYGKRYFRDKFGKDITVAWTPDSFGYNWNLPQILVKSGMTGFLTQKLGSNEQTKFPHTIFWWKGADDSEVLTYFPMSGYANNVNQRSLTGQLATVKNRHGVDDNFVIFGVGDHGGGVTRGHLDRIFEMKKSDTAPKVVFSTAEDYFNHLQDLSKTHDFPVWDDELYLEHHRGTYTSQANNKKHNRRTEQLLMDSEKLAVIAGEKFGSPYPAARIFDNGWKWVLLNHMHDILPGSGIRAVYEDSDKDYAKVYETADAVIGGSLDTIAADVDTSGGDKAIVVFNTLSWQRDAIVETPLPGEISRLEDPDGNEIAFQKTEKDGEPHLLFIARDLPAVGYKVFKAYENGKASPATPAVTITPGSMENSFIKITFDEKSGELASLFDKTLNREFLDGSRSSNAIQAFVDTQNAWEIQSDIPIEFPAANDAKLIENGPVRWTIKTTRKVQESPIEIYTMMYADDPRVHFRINMDWNDHNVTTKLAFFLNMLSEDAWFEIPYAAISRKAIAKSMAEKAKFEVSAHKWIDYTDQDGSAGLSLLNNSKYGFDVKYEVMRMTLLRSPIKPDPMADIGKHSIEYALYPHGGDWRDADTSRRGYEFNYKPHVTVADAHKGALPAQHSFFSAGPDNVALTVVKEAEDGDGIIIRFVETEGRSVQAAVTLPWDIKEAVETNLIEDEIDFSATVTIDGNTLKTALGKYEIKTLKIKK